MKVRERDVQDAIVKALELCQMTVLHTSAWKQRGPSGVSPGVPDLLVYVPGLPFAAIGLEIKRPGGKLSPAQQLHVDARRYLVATSPEEALDRMVEAIDQLASGWEDEASLRQVIRLINRMRAALGGGNEPL